jgi:hypothetical protein
MIREDADGMPRGIYGRMQRPFKIITFRRSKDSVPVREVNCSCEDSPRPKDSLPFSLDDAGCDGGSWSQRLTGGHEVGLPLRLSTICELTRNFIDKSPDFT